jgi:DNA (cytosine-5)-methyltransferase 1
MLDQGAPDADELIIDSFAGGGGASTGIEMALGRSPDYAINHDAEALALHAANHPETVHLSKNIYKVDPMDVVGRRKVGLLWASPDCKHFSKAKGGKPVKRNIRDLAWTVVLWAERVRPRVIILENVEEFQTWGPLIETAKGIFPCPDRKGETFNEWIAALRKHGYKVDWKELRACDYGAPTTRKRLFLIARCDGKKITWPAPTHGPGKLPYHTAASHVIDWSIPCPSIFDTSEEIMAKFGVRAIRPLAENTMARIAKGVKRYVLDAAKPFVIKFQTGAVGSDIDAPLPTVTANSFIKRPGGAAPLGVVMPHLMTMRNAGKPYNEADKPTHTVTVGGAGLSLVAPVLSAAQHGGSVRGADEPVHTLTASPKDQNQIIAAHLSAYYGPGGGSDDRSADVAEPIRTVVTENRHAVVSAFLAQHNTMPAGGIHPGHHAEAPISAVTASGSQQAVVSAGLMNMKGSQRASLPIDGGTPTQTAGGEHVAEVRAFLMKYYGVDQDPRLGEPLSTVTTRDRFGIVTVEGEPYEIVDIGMRMLTPRELFKAQGFPADYEIEMGVFADGSRRALTKTAQVRMCGNSVCPPIAAALVAANCADMVRMERVAAE